MLRIKQTVILLGIMVGSAFTALGADDSGSGKVKEFLEAFSRNARPDAYVRFTANLTEYSWKDENKSLVAKFAMTTTLQLGKGGALRVDYSPRSLRTIGRDEFVDENLHVIYTGKRWFCLKEGERRGTSYTGRHIATITAERPDIFNDEHYETGEAFLLSKAMISARKTMDEMIQKNTFGKFDIEGEGKSVRILSYKDAATYNRVYVDASKGFNFVKVVSQHNLDGAPADQFTIEYQNSEFKEVAPGLFFPTKSTRKFTVAGALKVSDEFEVTKVELLDSAEKDAFKVEIPHGWLVEDHIIGQTFRVGDSLDKVIESFDAAAKPK